MTDLQNKIQTNIIVFTGLSSPEKTATIEKFRELGYDALKTDIATTYIEEIKESLAMQYSEESVDAINEKFYEFAKTEVFNNEILKRKLAYEQTLDSNLNTKKITIIDSALACGMVYPEVFNYQVQPELNEQINQRLAQYRYKLIFSFDMFEFHANGILYETQTERENLDSKLREHYQTLGYSYIRVPSMLVTDPNLNHEEKIRLSIEKRVKFITSMIRHNAEPAVEMVYQGTKLFSNNEISEPCNIPSQRAVQSYQGAFFYRAEKSQDNGLEKPVIIPTFG